MLIFNPERVCALRGIVNPGVFMVGVGIDRRTTNNLLRQQTSIIKIEHLELFCRHLNCTPSDLFEWQDDKSLPEKHSLQSLKRSQNANSIKARINEIPLEEVEKIIERN